jgi:hypothetical protein
MQQKRNSTSRTPPWFGAVFHLSLLASAYPIQTACAGVFAYGVGYVGEYSDNIGRTPTNPQDEWINSAIAGITYRENGATLDANLMAQAEYRDYKYDTYKDGPLYYADASFLWRVSPQRLNWVFVDRYDQVTRNITLANTPDNMVGANVLSTGPDFFIRLGSVNTLLIGLRYGNASYSEGDLDNSRYSATASWQYASSRDLTYSLNYRGEQTKYENEVLNDNSMRNDLFFRADMRQVHTQFLLDLGTTHIDRDRAGEAHGYIARLTWAQQLTTESAAGVLLASEFLDAGAALLATATNPVLATGTGTTSSLPASGEVTNDLYYTKRAEAYYDHTGSSVVVNTRIFIRDIDYEIVPQDRQEAGGRMQISYNLSRLLAATLYGSYVDIRYQNIVREDRESDAGLRFLYRSSSNLSVALEGRKTWHYSTDALQEFIDRRVLLSLLYSTSPLFTTARR